MLDTLSLFSIDKLKYKRLNLTLNDKLNNDNIFMFIDKDNYNIGFYYLKDDVLFETYTVVNKSLVSYKFIHGHEKDIDKILIADNFASRKHEIGDSFGTTSYNLDECSYVELKAITELFINSLKTDKSFRYLFLTEKDLYKIVKRICDHN